MCVLAGILITVGIGIIDKKGINDLFYMPRADAVVLLIVLLLTVFLDLLQAVGVGMVIASVLFMKRASDLVDSGTALEQMTKFDKEVKWEDEGDITEEMLKEIYIQRLNGPVFFGSVTKFQELMTAIPQNAKVVIIRMRRVPYMDMSGLYAMESAIINLQEKGIIVLLTIIQHQPMYMLKKINLVPGLVPENHCFKTFEDCAAWLKNEYFKV
jgi:SulP family sulfate permease